jgi:hypothetical protein
VDEYEELELVLAHYALAWGSKVDIKHHPALAKNYNHYVRNGGGSGSVGGLVGWGLTKEVVGIERSDHRDEE